MKKEEMFELMNANPAFHLATVEGDQPRCRGMFLFRADENGIIFHSGIMKDVHKQISKNPKVELCFNDFKKGIQVRVSGKLEISEDKVFKDEICEHPSRKFLKSWRESGTLANFYDSFKVYCLKGGKAVYWTMETNFAPKVEVVL
ncbi:pyridoxamine 5'-phosphate oxidase [candidate division WOR-1 bacterium RIFOXYD2_FULL_36_8]|uniref:Pyridoxamine 5'-phosphate oxidase n=1 Tax=candidate division WOR-1 bacterium RIFOXYB2_FULL_36_35 TaxID=1802578 RepID=A0A1F4S166_UNCSA|nr:MAG: pyridoxamine 5'-phosphate oxidase [candidate division WOR-1 bacterium RIFOXYA2_FULL_36_21]OGC14150.1 MAG: pyridoxamine 5'-phosphate oxidase [candidate division WOR-1 bacterium RIFOXYB2_FULL_36_35]OGC15372.1 MAG: pyridoxamine 5'-phosphate oxidase [candidate division WOR-1 bacterium RIFOXYA12_FULL_36_13]OGC38636.1 MAG: pyridoxamine 5'-phosphate oxidase [candidate division WOR-1 bacterium RIFOXYD2_FULL_36_8]